jgi:hypothetical protein
VVVLTGLGFVTAAVNAIIRILRHGTRKGPPAIAFPPFRRHTPVVAIGCVTTLALMLGLPLTYAYGGAPGSAMISGSVAIWSYRRRPLFSCCFPSGGSITRAAGP